MTMATMNHGAVPVASRRPGGLLSGPTVLLLPALVFLAVVYVLPVIDLVHISFSGPTLLGYFERFFSVPLYWDSLVRTMQIALTVSFLCLVLGYPTALLIHRSSGIAKVLISAAIVLPYFIAILIRTYAWMVLLGRNGPINKLMVWLGIVSEPAQLLFNRGSVLVAMTAVLLPLMVLTLYSSISRLDPGLNRAALACGAGPIAVFWRIILPLTLPGIGAGFLLVFVSALGFFITPTLLGGPATRCSPCTSPSRRFRHLGGLSPGPRRGAAGHHADRGGGCRQVPWLRVHLGRRQAVRNACAEPG